MSSEYYEKLKVSLLDVSEYTHIGWRWRDIRLCLLKKFDVRLLNAQKIHTFPARACWMLNFGFQ